MRKKIIISVTFNMLKNNALTDVSSKHQEHVLKIQCAMITDDGTSYSKKLNLGYCRNLPFSGIIIENYVSLIKFTWRITASLLGYSKLILCMTDSPLQFNLDRIRRSIFFEAPIFYFFISPLHFCLETSIPPPPA